MLPFLHFLISLPKYGLYVGRGDDGGTVDGFCPIVVYGMNGNSENGTTNRALTKVWYL